MKATVLGTAAGVGLLIVAAVVLVPRSEVLAQRLASPLQPAAYGDLIVVPTPVSEKGQSLVVVDPKARVMAVYQIDLATGKIALQSVRNIQWDLQMVYLNNENPLPQEIRALLEQR